MYTYNIIFNWPEDRVSPYKSTAPLQVSLRNWFVRSGILFEKLIPLLHVDFGDFLLVLAIMTAKLRFQFNQFLRSQNSKFKRKDNLS